MLPGSRVAAAGPCCLLVPASLALSFSCLPSPSHSLPLCHSVLPPSPGQCGSILWPDLLGPKGLCSWGFLEGLGQRPVWPGALQDMGWGWGRRSRLLVFCLSLFSSPCGMPGSFSQNRRAPEGGAGSHFTLYSFS